MLWVLVSRAFPLSLDNNFNNSKGILHRVSVCLGEGGALGLGLGISGCTKFDQELVFCSICF